MRRPWRHKACPNRLQSMLITPSGERIGPMSHVRARGIAAALNTTEGREAYEAERTEFARKLR